MFLWVKDFHASFFIKKVEKEDIFSKGDNTIKEFCKVITRIPGFSPYEYQLNLMSIVLEMIIPTFYWYMWQDYKSIVLKRYNQKSIPQICSSCAARRDGKSTFFQMVCIGLALCVPRRQNEYRYGVGLVSINLNGSIKMIQDIYDMMLLLNYPGVKIVHTATKIIVKHSDGINAILGFQTGEVSLIYTANVSYSQQT